MFWRQKNKNMEDQAMRALGTAVQERHPGCRCHLYLEMTAVNADGALIVQRESGLCAKPLDDMVRTLARSMWNEFRLASRPQWQALELTSGPGGEFSTTLIYTPVFDDSVGFRRRVQRWSIKILGPEGLAALDTPTAQRIWREI
jgi:hypothetical protein